MYLAGAGGNLFGWVVPFCCMLQWVGALFSRYILLLFSLGKIETGLGFVE